MASASEMLRRLQSVSRITTLRDMVYDVILENEHILRDLKEDEFEQGDIYSDQTTRRYKNVDYADYKNEINPRAGYGVVDLMNTGAFVKSLKIGKPNLNKYKFNSTDPKKNKIFRQYGNGVRGLNQNTFNDYQFVIIKPIFIERLSKIINKK